MIKIPKADLISKISFVLLMFFSFFPSEMPFQSKMQERGAEEIASSNIINQIIYLTIFLFAFIGAIPIKERIVEYIKKEKALIFFLIWALITISWSNFAIVSFKRYFQVLTFYLTIITYLIYYPSISDLVKLFKHITYPYIFLTIVVVLIIPDAKDPSFGTWRGFTNHKNSLGQIGVILSVITYLIYQNEIGLKKKIISLQFFFLSIIITIGAFSSTALTALSVFLFISILFSLKRRIFESIGAGTGLFLIMIFFSFLMVLLTFIFFPQVTDLIEELFGKDEAFYDRGKLWKVMLFEISSHPIQGCGFQGFWFVESPKIQMLYKVFIWLPIQAHNGYLDLINELGLIGLFLFLVVIYRYFKVSFSENRVTLWAWFIIIPLIISLTESTLFRPGHKSTIFFFLSYLLLFRSKLNFSGNG